MPTSTLRIDRTGHIATVTLDRPAVGNAFNDAMVGELRAAFDDLGREAPIRAIVLAAQGPLFCAGADLEWMRHMATHTHDDNRADALRLAAMLHTLYVCPKPVIARIQGDCYGGGLGLAAACDIAVASETARFCLAEVKLGLIPATISPYVLRAIGQQAARRYFLTAERFSAWEAHRLGLVHELAAPAALDAAVAAICEALAAAGPQAIAQAKQLVREIAGRPIDEALLADTAERIAQSRASDEGREGVQAFLDKRAPSWRA